MSNTNLSYFQSVHTSKLTEKELINCVAGMPALLFRIEIIKNKIEYLNNYKISGFEEYTFLLLKNKKVSKELIYEKDFAKYTSFIENIHKSKEDTVIIRLRKNENDVRWIKIIGGPNPYNPGFYLGVLMDVTQSIHLVEELIEEENELQVMLEMADNPVILVNMMDKKVVSHNSAAVELFGYGFEEFQKLYFSDLYHNSLTSEINRIFEDVIFESKWEGKLFYKRKNNGRFLGKTVLRLVKIKDKRFLRISIYNVDMAADIKNFGIGNLSNNPLTDSKIEFENKLVEKVIGIEEMQDLLQTFLDNSYDNNNFDGIIYSDIHLKKEKISVYAVGEMFKNLGMGKLFTYEGTIAENIEQYKLDYLIIDDTMTSIKAIDWALFIPYGVRSYYAKPFYERNTLRSVLILCSSKTNFFKEDKIDVYNLYNKAFVKGLKNWRKYLRVRKK